MRGIEKDIETRVRKQGAFHHRTTGNGIWASFTHFLSRPVDGSPDPQLHAHNMLFNVTFDPVEKEWKAGEFGQVYLDGNYYEACFMTRLAAGMMELGYKIERRGKFWDIAGLDKSLLDKFSRRTKEIEAEALKRGITDPDRKGELGAKTRKSKKPQSGHGRASRHLDGKTFHAGKAHHCWGSRRCEKISGKISSHDGRKNP